MHERALAGGLSCFLWLLVGCHLVFPFGAGDGRAAEDRGPELGGRDVAPDHGHDLVPKPPPVDAWLEPDAFPQQGTTCTYSATGLYSVEFVASNPPLTGQTIGSLSVAVTPGVAWTNVMVGVVPLKPALGCAAYYEADSTTTCGSPGPCTWTFTNVAVPSEQGPYRFSFLKDAGASECSKGSVAGECQP